MLDKILRHRSLREKAIAVALDHLGDRGHDLLLQFVNDERTIPPYGLRHRALDALAGNEALRGEIDQRANLLRDLDQFADTTRPCGHFMQLLIAVNRGIESGVVDVEFRERLADDKLKLPTLPAEGEPESGEAEACAQVAEAHEATLAALREKFPEKKKRRPTKKKTKKKRRSR